MRATQYMIVAPSQEPIVPAMIMPAMLNLPVLCAKWAAGGITTSLGNGSTELSAAMSSTTSG